MRKFFRPIHSASHYDAIFRRMSQLHRQFILSHHGIECWRIRMYATSASRSKCRVHIPSHSIDFVACDNRRSSCSFTYSHFAYHAESLPFYKRNNTFSASTQAELIFSQIDSIRPSQWLNISKNIQTVKTLRYGARRNLQTRERSIVIIHWCY